MVKVISKLALAAVCILALAMFTQQAKADGADFSCGGTTNCSGSVTVSGSNYSSTGITLTAGSPFSVSGFSDQAGESFTLAFDTNAGTISLTDATDNDATLSGTIVSFTTNSFGGQTQVTMDVNWNIPGYHAGLSTVSFLINSSNAVNSVDVSVLPTPEPASLMLLGTGLLGMGAAVRRRLLN